MMGRDGKGLPSLGLLVLCLVLVVSATTADEKCRSGCSGTPSVFKYAEGKTYKYNYEGSIDISLSTAEGQVRSTKVKATVLLSQLPNCNQNIRLQNVLVIDSDGKKYTHIEDVEKPIRINFKDGKIADSICAEPDDSQNSLNIKRAIASFFQADLKEKYETDVFGLCPTDITSRKEGNFLVIHKNRNLNKCAYRESIKQDFLATAFNLNSEIKSSPLLSGDYSSQQRVKNGILDQATVTENYLYVPFSIGKNGAKATVQSKLQFVGEGKDAGKSKVSEPRSIIFENPHLVNTPKSNVDIILKAVKYVSDTIDTVVGQFTAKSFVNLVKIVRESQKDDLLGVFNQIKAGVGFRDKEVSKRVFLDALFRAGTGEALEVAIELLKNNQLSPLEKRLVYLGLSFVNHATKTSLNAAAALLDEPDVPREAYLGVGTLAGRFCRQHSCKNLDSLNKLTQKLASKIGDGKAANRQQENEIIYSLKALGNINYLSDSIVAKLVHIAQDQKAPTRLRVAALEAYLADPCKEKLKDSALSILKDIEQDSEIRIKAFLVLVKCPCGKVANALKNLLENEPSYQVGGFIVSTLRNIRASANPDKELAKQQLGAIVLPRRFPFDFRKYSFNGELSYAFDSFGIANAAEANVIYSQDSFLPRSTSLNLTTQLFGHSFNFLEISTRQENLDKLIESYFGPQGSVTKEARKIVKRSVSQGELDKFGKSLQLKGNKLNNDLDVDLSVKLFGSEFLFLNLNEDFQKYSPESVLDRVYEYVNKGVEDAKNFDKSIRSNVLFLDAELAYPTSLGFPLRLSVEGSSSIQIQTSGNVDLDALSKLDRTVSLKLKLIPSANIEIAGRITFDAFVLENGLKVASTLYTATGGDINVQIYENLKGVDVKFGLPIEKQTIVSATHDIVFTTRELGQLEKSVPLKFVQNNDFAVCLDQLKAFVGITACADIVGPNLSGDHVPILPFPLNGNSKYTVTLERDDISVYHLSVQLPRGENGKLGFEVNFDALGKSNNKKISLGLQGYLRPEAYFKAFAEYPGKKAGAEARFVSSGNERAALARFYIDNDEYYAKAGLEQSGGGARTAYKPILEYKTPRDKAAQKPPYNIDGQIVVESNDAKRVYIFENLKFSLPNQKAVALNGKIGHEPGYYFLDLSVSDNNNKGALKSSVKLSGETRAFNVEFQDTFVGLDVKLELEGSPKTFKYDFDAKYQDVKLGSELDIKHCQKAFGDYEVDFEAYGFNNKLEFEAKRDVLDDGQKSKIENSLEFNGKKFELDGTVNHRFQPQNIDVGSDLVIKISGQSNPIKIVDGFVLTANEVDTKLNIASGSNVLIDALFKATRAGDANGALRVNLKDYLVANGQIKANKGNGNGNIVVELVKIDKKLKGETKFTLQNPNYNLGLTFYPDFGKTPDKKFSFSTTNKLQENSLDSKNNFVALDYKLEANLKGNYEGNAQTGKANGEFEVTLPNDIYFVGKFNRDVKTVNDVINGYFLASLEQRDNKNVPGRKISLKGTAKDTNLKAGVFDIVYNLAADDSNGKNLSGDLSLKRNYQNGLPYLQSNAKLYGSVLPNPLEGNFEYNGGKGQSGNYKVKGSYGSDTYFKVDGDYNVDTSENYAYDGKFSGELKVPKLTSDAGIDVSAKAELSLKKHSGSFKGNTKLQNLDPIAFSASYGHADDKGVSKCNSEAQLEYGKGKKLGGSVALIRQSANQYEVDAKLALPSEQVKNIGVQVSTKRSEDGNAIDSDLTLTADGKKYSLSSNFVLGENNPSARVVLIHPDGRKDEFSGKLNKASDRRFDAELKVLYAPADFSFDSSIDANLEDIENFAVKVTLDSPKLKLNKIVAEAYNKGTVKGARRIQFSAKSDSKNLLSGSTSYKAHEENNKFIVEGSGTVKLYEESKSANFKYIRNNLSLEKNGERGIQIIFDASLGNKGVDSELKITNKQFRISNSYCEEKKQCANIEIDSKTSVNDLQGYNNEFEVAIDLRKLGLSHEFGLKAVTVRKQFTFDHTVDVHFQSQENSKYQYSVYVHPKEAGVSLTTPKRIIALEATANNKDQYNYEGQLSLYLDKKNKPKDVASLTGTLVIGQKEPNVRGQLAFNSPGLSRPLSIKYNSEAAAGNSNAKGSFELILDVLADESKKFVITGKSNFGKGEKESAYEGSGYVQIVNSALQIDIKIGESLYVDLKDFELKYIYGVRYNVKKQLYDTGVNLRVRSDYVEASAKLLSQTLIKSTTKLQLSAQSQIIDNTLEVYKFKPIVSNLQLKNRNVLKYTVDYENIKLEVNAGLVLGQIADFRADVQSGGAKKELARASVKLDEANFLKSDYFYSSENVQNYLLNPSKEAVKKQIKEVKDLVPTVYQQTGDELKKLGGLVQGAAPNGLKIKAYYEQEASKIKEEVLQDKTIKNLSEFLKNIIGAAAEAFSDVLAQFSALVESIVKTLQANFSGVAETFNKDILPKLKEVFEKLVKETANVADKFADVFFAYLGKISEFIDAHQAEFKQIATSVTSVSEDLLRFFLKSYESVRELLEQQFKLLADQLKAPIFEEIKLQYEQLVKQTLGDSQQVKERIERLKQDVIAALNELFNNGLEALKKLANAAAAQDLRVGGDLPYSPFVPEYFLKLPRLVAAKFSPLTYLINGDYQLSLDLLYSLSLNPRLYFPPIPLYALVTQGLHIFTFDGKHITFPGKCDYLLARDALEGNFSIVGSYSNGLLTAITLYDKSDSVTLKKGGQILLNNANAELPVIKKSLIAYRKYESVALLSLYGVKVICGLQLVTCSITVDGFYHGRLRGLLGDGNYEQYDDLTLPNGKIAKTESDFGNAYKLSASCPNVKALAHHHGHGNEACSKLFGRDSALRYCFNFVDPQNYKTACEHGLAEGVADTEFAVSVAYVAACNHRGIPIRVPEEYVKCQNSKQTYKVGDKFSVKTPAKSADIVLLIDQNKNNEETYKELLQPLVQQLNQELNTKGINDVEYHLITYGGENPTRYPAHITVGGKYTFKGKAPNLKFAETQEPTNVYQFNCKSIDQNNKFVQLLSKYFNPTKQCNDVNEFFENAGQILDDLDLAVGNTAQAKTYDAGLSYPFRAESVKVVLAVTGNECEVGKFLPLQIARTLFYRNNQIFLNLVTPLGNFRVKDPKTTKETVGFNDHTVFTLAQAAKKKADGGAELHKQLEYVDYCSKFTVNNGGNVFVTDNFLQTKGPQRKQFIQVVAHNIVDQVTSVEKGLDCECRFITPFSAANECKVAYSKAKNVPGRKG